MTDGVMGQARPASARPGRRVMAAALAALLAVSACASGRGSAPSFDSATSGLTADQRTVREVAQGMSPPQEQGGSNWFGENAIIILAAAGCVAGAAIGGSAGDCLTGAAIGGLAGAVARITVLDDRDDYANDSDFVNAVSDEMDRVLQENERLVPAAERLAEAHEAALAEWAEDYRRGVFTKSEYRKKLEPLLVDEQAMIYIVESNRQLMSDLDKSLTGISVASSQQKRLEDQEGIFLADAGRIQYAQERLSAALARVPTDVLK